MSTSPEHKSGVWIAVGDIHDDSGNFAKIPELKEADGVIVTGDLTITGGERQARQVMDAIESTGLPVLAQIGNMDREEVNSYLTGKNCNIHCQVRELAPDIAVMGLGGSTFTPFSTPSEFPESAFATWLDEMWPRARKFRHVVLVSHTPPKDTTCDDIGGNTHVGSEAVRDFIVDNQPDICICGHIHEARSIDRIGRTIIVNPGQLSQGGYVILREDNGSLSVELGQTAAEE